MANINNLLLVVLVAISFANVSPCAKNNDGKLRTQLRDNFDDSYNLKVEWTKEVRYDDDCEDCADQFKNSVSYIRRDAKAKRYQEGKYPESPDVFEQVNRLGKIDRYSSLTTECKKERRGCLSSGLGGFGSVGDFIKAETIGYKTYLHFHRYTLFMRNIL